MGKICRIKIILIIEDENLFFLDSKINYNLILNFFSKEYYYRNKDMYIY